MAEKPNYPATAFIKWAGVPLHLSNLALNGFLSARDSPQQMVGVRKIIELIKKKRSTKL